MRVEIFKEEEFESVQGYKPIEQETACMKVRNEDKWLISTTDNTMISKLKRKFLESKGLWKAYKEITIDKQTKKEEITTYFFEVPKNAVAFRTGIKRETHLTEEQRKAVSERFKKK